jgi:hypothetical protein
MNTEKIVEALFYILPAILVAGVTYSLIKTFLENEEKKRFFDLQKDIKKDVLPIKLQAYERMVLFLERINLNKMLFRVMPQSSDKNDYENLLIAHIESEFEHNLTQQIYISNECWSAIITAKNALIQNIRKVNMNVEVSDAKKLREALINDMLESTSPSFIAISVIKDEVAKLLG